MENTGHFIVLEGIDGSGKTTQLSRLADRMREAGRQVYVTAEPTSSVSGGMLRDALGGISHRSPCEMAALFTLDRIFHNVNPINGIRKFLRAGIDVLCDRYYYSSLAYQGSETDAAWVRHMNLDCPEIRKPDLCVFLDLTPEESLARISKGRMVTEIYEEKSRLTAVRAKFMQVLDSLKEQKNIAVIDASAAIDKVEESVWNAVKEIL